MANSSFIEDAVVSIEEESLLLFAQENKEIDRRIIIKGLINLGIKSPYEEISYNKEICCQGIDGSNNIL